MTRPAPSRRALLQTAALLSAAALSGCGSFDDLFEANKAVISGKREPVLGGSTTLQPDPADHRAINLPPPVANADWPQSGDTPAHVLGNHALGDLGRSWRRSIGEGGGYRRKITATPVIAGGRVFAMDSDATVSAFDVATGDRHWHTDTQPKKNRSDNVGGGIAEEGGVLYAVTGRGEAMAIDPRSGKITWRVPLGAPGRSAPTVAEGKLFVPTIDERLVCLAAADGKQLWNYQATESATTFLGEPAPAYTDGFVIAGFGSGDLVTLRADGGTLVWTDSLASARGRTSLADLSAIRALPVVQNGTVYAIGLGGLLVALDLRSGRRLWERDVAGQQTPCVAGDWMFVLTDQQELVCISCADGRVRWLSQMPRYRNEKRLRGPLFWMGPILGGNYLYLGGTTSRLIAVNPANGEIVGSRKIPDKISVAPVAASQKLFVVTEDATLSALG